MNTFSDIQFHSTHTSNSINGICIILGSFDLSAIQIGTYKQPWFMWYHNILPEEAIYVHLEIRSRILVGFIGACSYSPMNPLTSHLRDSGGTERKRDLSRRCFPFSRIDRQFFLTNANVPEEDKIQVTLIRVSGIIEGELRYKYI